MTTPLCAQCDDRSTTERYLDGAESPVCDDCAAQIDDYNGDGPIWVPDMCDRFWTGRVL